MSVTADVLKLERLRKASEEQPPNISLMLVTLAVSKLERFREVREEQPSNM